MKPEPYEGWNKFIFHIHQGFFILFSVALWMNYQPQIMVVNWHNIHHNVYVSNTAISDKSQVLVSSIWPQSSIVDFDTLVGCKKWPWFSPDFGVCWVKKNLFYGVKTTWIYGPLSLSNHDLSFSTGLIYSNVLRPSLHNGSIYRGVRVTPHKAFNLKNVSVWRRISDV